MDTSSKFFVLLKNGATPLIVLLSITLVTRLLLIASAPFVYHFDAYAYVSKAIAFISSGTIQFDVGMPFVIFLGGFYYLFGAAFGALSASRILMLLMSMLIVSVIYLFGLKLSGKIFGFIVALIAIFEPLFLSYSIVPHNDVFSIAMGLAALHFATSDKKFGYFLSPFLFYIAILTRPELSLVLVVPILSFLALKLLKTRSLQTVMYFVLSIFVYILPLVWAYNVAQTWTRFEVVEKFTLFLTPELLRKTLESSLSFYDQPLLNHAVFSFIALGVMLGLLKVVSQFFVFQKREKGFSIKFKKDGAIKEKVFSDRAILVFLLLLVFVLHIIVLTAYGYGYVIVDGQLVVGQLTERYLILSRLLLSFPLAYPLTIVVKKFWSKVIHEK